MSGQAKKRRRSGLSVNTAARQFAKLAQRKREERAVNFLLVGSFPCVVFDP
jgi:hypothetical protein